MLLYEGGMCSEVDMLGWVWGGEAWSRKAEMDLNQINRSKLFKVCIE